MRYRYLNTSGGAEKVSSVMYYDHDGKFCGVKNGTNVQDDDAFLKIGW